MDAAGKDASEKGGPSHAAPTPGENVLLLAPSMEWRAEERCIDCSTPDDPSNVAYLAVALDSSVDAVLDRWRRFADDVPSRLAVVSVGERTRSAAASAGAGTTMGVGTDFAVSTVADTSDLTGIGIKVSQCLASWEDGSEEKVLCFDSLTTLLQFVDLKRAFRFLHVLTARVSNAGARAHFHADPGAHDERTLATLRGLFDVTYELDADGTWHEA